ncbi:MAG: leucyl/phenylalanyl-tRNA--protein transferase [Nitrosomonas sp.]|nr:leucyl/phenylalanyl-tRNA--protein transferase [Nitrosomonas sp.]
MIPFLLPYSTFPPLKQALREPNGLLAAGGDLSIQRLLAAYKRGVFPWFSAGEPILWWSPDPRMVLFPADIRISRSLHKTLKHNRYTVRVDSAFSAVMQACAAPRHGQDGTWIHPEMITAYENLHQQGLCHSVEIWQDNELVGGLYGVALGRIFFGESMFSRVSDASKIALVYLARQLEKWDFGLIDCQMQTAHLASMGAMEIPRQEFANLLTAWVDLPTRQGQWNFDYTYSR